MEYLQRMLNKSKALVSNHFWGITWSILRQMNQITLVLYSRNDFFYDFSYNSLREYNRYKRCRTVLFHKKLKRVSDQGNFFKWPNFLIWYVSEFDIKNSLKKT